ncbi:hypothetical protein BH11PLA1_BH11PLA1_22230 [soil metagenome]
MTRANRPRAYIFVKTFEPAAYDRMFTFYTETGHTLNLVSPLWHPLLEDKRLRLPDADLTCYITARRHIVNIEPVQPFRLEPSGKKL